MKNKNKSISSYRKLVSEIKKEKKYKLKFHATLGG